MSQSLLSEVLSRCRALLAIALVCAGSEPRAQSAEHKARLGPFQLDERELQPSLGMSLAFSSDGKGLVLVRTSADGDLHIHRWILPSGARIDALVKDPEPYREDPSDSAIDWPGPFLSASVDASLVAFRGNHGTIFICETASGKLLHKFATKIGCPVLSPDGKIVAHVDDWQNSHLVLIDVQTGKVLGSIPDNGTQAGCFSADHQTIAVYEEPRGPTVWRIGQRVKRAMSLKTPDSWICTRGFISPNGNLIATPGFKSGPAPEDQCVTVFLWEVATGKLIWQARADFGVIQFSSDNRRIAVTCWMGETGLFVWNAKTGVELVRIKASKKPVKQANKNKNNSVCNFLELGLTDLRFAGPIAFAPDGKTLATVGADGFIRLWNTDTGAELTGK